MILTLQSFNHERKHLKGEKFPFCNQDCQFIQIPRKESREYILSQQLIRCGTSIGALIREAEHAESRKDFIHKLSISLKETNECKFWLDLLVATDFITKEMFASINKDCEELLKLLTSIVKTTKQQRI